MTLLFQNRTISMIVMVPNAECLSSSASSSLLSIVDGKVALNHGDTSMPIYQGSIIGIEQASDDQNASDLIVRVPNFQRLSLPSITLSGETSISDNHSSQLISSAASTTRMKRRAPICPIVNGSSPSSPMHRPVSAMATHSQRRSPSSSLHLVNAHRLTSGLRSFSRALTHGCRSKRSNSISEVTYPSSLPDVEVMKESLPSSKSTVVPKLSTPKVLLTKKKSMKVKETCSSSLTIPSPIPAYAEVKKQITKTTSFIRRSVEKHDEEVDFDDHDRSKQTVSMDLVSEVTQSFPTLSKFVPSMPIPSTDAVSLSTHRYSTISAIVTDIQNIIADNEHEESQSQSEFPLVEQRMSIGIPNRLNIPFRVQTTILQPDISVIRLGMVDHDRTRDSTDTIPECIEQELSDESEHEEQCQQERFSECYEVDYQLDPTKELERPSPSISKSSMQGRSTPPLRIDLDPAAYRNLTTSMTTWLPTFPLKSSNIYERIDSGTVTQSNEKLGDAESLHHTPPSSPPQVKAHSVDDLTQDHLDPLEPFTTLSPRHCVLRRSQSYDGFGVSIGSDVETRREHVIYRVEEQSPGDRAGLKENDRVLCINGTSVIDEDYTVVLQLLRESFQNDQLNFQVIEKETYEEFHQRKESFTSDAQ